MKIIYYLVLLLATLPPSIGKVIAHDPGISFANADISSNHLNLRFSFALSDIETLSVINSNNDEQFSQNELDDANAGLSKLFSDGIEVRIENSLWLADSINMSIERNESLIVRLTFNALNTNNFSLYMPILKQLPRGHRQYLLVNGNAGSYQNVLSANSEPIYVDVDAGNFLTIFKLYFSQGIQHLFTGFDHILFLLTLLLPAVLIMSKNHYQARTEITPAFIDTFKIVTAFSLAHSITLGLAVFQIVQLPGRFVESMIAFSIIICAINNLKPILPAPRWFLAFGFGLIHGFGFANTLTNMGIESKNSIIPLLGFNLGIETGQLVIVTFLLPIIYLIRHSTIFRLWIFKGGSFASILIASGWMLERTF